MHTTYDDGTPVFNNLHWQQACIDCDRKGIGDRCTHVTRMSGERCVCVHTVDCDRHATALFLVASAGPHLGMMKSIDSAAYAREMLNRATAPLITSAFRREWIDAMVARQYTLDKTCSHMFVTIDPSGGMQRNQYAIQSHIFVDGQMVVCFLPPPHVYMWRLLQSAMAISHSVCRLMRRSSAASTSGRSVCR